MTALRMMRLSNAGRVLDALRVRGESTRAELVAATGISRSTLCMIVSDLIAEGAIQEETAPPPAGGRTGRGRPTRTLNLNRSMAKVAGIEIGRAHVCAVATNLAQEVITRNREEIDTLAHPAEAVRLGIDMVSGAAAEGQLSVPRLAAVAVGLPGASWSGDPRSRGPERTHEMRRLVERMVPDLLGIVPVMDNNTRLIALAEAQWGSGAGVDEQLYVHVDVGVGGGIVVNGRLHRGGAGAAGEIGHICVEPTGPRCWCGGIGCLERLVSLPVLVAAAEVSDEVELATAAKDAGSARRIVATAAERLGTVLAGVAATLNPDVIVLGGRTSRLPGFAGRVDQVVRDLAPTASLRQLRILPARLGTFAGAMGGVALALHTSPLLAGYGAGAPASVTGALTP